MDDKKQLLLQIEFLRKTLTTIAGEPCLWLEENFNHDVSCNKQSWPEETSDNDFVVKCPHCDIVIYRAIDWCSVCIAKAALEHFMELARKEN